MTTKLTEITTIRRYCLKVTDFVWKLILISRKPPLNDKMTEFRIVYRMNGRHLLTSPYMNRLRNKHLYIR